MYHERIKLFYVLEPISYSRWFVWFPWRVGNTPETGLVGRALPGLPRGNYRVQTPTDTQVLKITEEKFCLCNYISKC